MPLIFTSAGSLLEIELDLLEAFKLQQPYVFSYTLEFQPSQSGLCGQLVEYLEEALIILRSWDYKKRAAYFHYNWLAWEQQERNVR